MKRMLATPLMLGALGLALAACESEAQDEINKQAEAIGESYDAEADLLEAQAENAPGEAVAEEQADALREKGEAIEEHLKDGADELD